MVHGEGGDGAGDVGHGGLVHVVQLSACDAHPAGREVGDAGGPVSGPDETVLPVGTAQGSR